MGALDLGHYGMDRVAVGDVDPTRMTTLAALARGLRQLGLGQVEREHLRAEPAERRGDRAPETVAGAATWRVPS